MQCAHFAQQLGKCVLFVVYSNPHVQFLPMSMYLKQKVSEKCKRAHKF